MCGVHSASAVQWDRENAHKQKEKCSIVFVRCVWLCAVRSAFIYILVAGFSHLKEVKLEERKKTTDTAIGWKSMA